MLPERQRLLSSISTQFGIIEACLMLKEKLPGFSPSLAAYQASARMTARGREEIERVLEERGKVVDEGDQGTRVKDATGLLYLFAFGSAIRRCVVELDAIEAQVEQLFGRDSAVLQKLFAGV
jgi:hypothetical protein